MVSVSVSGHQDLASRAEDNSQMHSWCALTISSRQTLLCLSDVLKSLFESQLEVSAVNTFPSSQTIKENVKQGEKNATVSGQILTHASCCDTVTVANYIFYSIKKYNLHNIKNG